jgi:TolA-binding protein
MINCNTCGKAVPDDSEFCPFCGNKIISVVDEHIDASEQLHLYQPSALLTRAFLFIEEESFDKADNYLEVVLNQEPENAQAYLGKLMVELRVKCKKDLVNCDTPFDCSKNYQKIVRFADKSLIDELEGYIFIIKERNAAQAEEKRKDTIYCEAVNDYNSYDIVRIQNAIKSFSSLAGYKDSDNLVELCKTKIEQIRIKEENDRVKAAQTAKRNKRILAFVTPMVIVLLAFIIVLNAVIIPNGKYNDAIALMDAGKYEEAISAFEKLDGYKNSEDKITECEMSILDDKYQTALALFNERKYTQAFQAFDALGEYKDSSAKASSCKDMMFEDKYQIALSLLNTQKYTEAIVAFEELDGYKDSATKIIACENAIIQQYENKYDLSEYIEVTIDELWNNYSTYNGQKVKIVGYVGCIEFDEPTYAEKYYDAFLVKDKTLSKEVTEFLGGYNYWQETLKLKTQYIGFRIMFSTYLQHVSSGTSEVEPADKIVLYGTFTYNPSTVDEGKRYITDPHGYDILVDHFFSMH